MIMHERPIILSAPMVRAILAGAKTQTRRFVNPQPISDPHYVGGAYIERRPGRTDGGKNRTGVAEPIERLGEFCPYGQPGDRLWSREKFRFAYDGAADLHYIEYADGERLLTPDSDTVAAMLERADWRPRSKTVDDDQHVTPRWYPSIHMPRGASRITLEVTAVRVERLHCISEDDAFAEGCPLPNDMDPICWYRNLWEQINGAGSWAANPWVWVVEFKRVQP
jgi:hypothetical protein